MIHAFILLLQELRSWHGDVACDGGFFYRGVRKRLPPPVRLAPLETGKLYHAPVSPSISRTVLRFREAGWCRRIAFWPRTRYNEKRESAMTIANYITIARIILIPFVLVILLTEMDNKEFIALAIYLIAAITDSLDGYIARRFNQVSDLGKFLDPLADKLLVSAMLLVLVYLNDVEPWVAALIILREIFISVFRFYFLVRNASFSASVPAKIKTTCQITSIAILMIYKKLPFSNTLFTFGTILLYIAVLLTVYSGIEYVVRLGRTVRNG